MIGKAPTTEDRIRAVAHGDFEAVGVAPDLQNGSVRGSGLDAETSQLVQIAALVAIDAPHVSWLRHLEAADDQEIELDKILGTLLSVAPVVAVAPDPPTKRKLAPRPRRALDPTAIDRIAPLAQP